MMKITNIGLVAALMLMGNAMASSQVVHKIDPIIQNAQGSTGCMAMAALFLGFAALQEYTKRKNSDSIFKKSISDNCNNAINKFKSGTWHDKIINLVFATVAPLLILRSNNPLMGKVSLAASLPVMVLHQLLS